MDTSTWGPKLWDCLFHCARNPDPAEARAVLRLVRELIPCALCRASYRHWHHTYPLGEGDAVELLWYIHDLVNGKLGKPRMPLSKLLARLATFGCGVSPFDVLNTLLILARHLPESEESAVALYHLIPLFAKISWLVSLRPRPMPGEPVGVTSAALFGHLVLCKQELLHEAGRSGRALDYGHEWDLYGGTLPTPVTQPPHYPQRRARGATPLARARRGEGGRRRATGA